MTAYHIFSLQLSSNRIRFYQRFVGQQQRWIIGISSLLRLAFAILIRLMNSPDFRRCHISLYSLMSLPTLWHTLRLRWKIPFAGSRKWLGQRAFIWFLPRSGRALTSSRALLKPISRRESHLTFPR